MKKYLFAFTLFFAASPVLASEDSLTRREGFLLLWNGILRPAEETREPEYKDVPEGSEGSFEITYAKRRGLLSDESEYFYPDDPLNRTDALVMMFRLWNIADVEEITAASIPDLLGKYQLMTEAQLKNTSPISQKELLDLQEKFKTMLKEEEHEVSLYSEKFHGKGTAFGETFDMHALTAAHPRFPHNTVVRVTNLENGKQVTVRINDRGPFVHGRSMDLSLAAFTTIAERSRGVIQVKLERLGDSSLVDNSIFTVPESIEHPEEEAVSACVADPVYAKRLLRGVSLTKGIPNEWETDKQISIQANGFVVIRGIKGPGGQMLRTEKWLEGGEEFTFTPEEAGVFVFKIGVPNGRIRPISMVVKDCSN